MLQQSEPHTHGQAAGQNGPSFTHVSGIGLASIAEPASSVCVDVSGACAVAASVASQQLPSLAGGAVPRSDEGGLASLAGLEVSEAEPVSAPVWAAEESRASVAK
jgi:hypothetical protein